MADEPSQAPEETQDTPVQEAAPDTGTPAQEQEERIDYEKRYNDLRPQFDQTTQEREQARQEALAWQILAASDDEEQVQQAADFLGVELESDDTDEDEFLDPTEQRLSEVEQQIMRQQEQENLKAFNSHVDELAKESDVKLSQRDRRVLLDASQEYGFNPDATEQAFKEFLDERKAYEKSVIDGYVKSKNAPHVSSVGGPQSTEDVLPVDATPQERQRWMTERYQMGQRQS